MEKFIIKNAECIFQTDKFLLIEAEDQFEEPVWIPTSQINYMSSVQSLCESGDLIIYKSWAIHKGWVKE